MAAGIGAKGTSASATTSSNDAARSLREYAYPGKQAPHQMVTKAEDGRRQRRELPAAAAIRRLKATSHGSILATIPAKSCDDAARDPALQEARKAPTPARLKFFAWAYPGDNLARTS